MSDPLFPPDEIARSTDHLDVERVAWISADARYRYHLTQTWAFGPKLTFVMLNPSTADALADDPTIVRCVGFAKREGYGGITVVNLYALRATKPQALWTADDPVGPANDALLGETLRHAYYASRLVVAAWGANAKPDRVGWLMSQPGAAQLHALGTTKAGQPRHPLYLRGDSPLVPYRGLAR